MKPHLTDEELIQELVTRFDRSRKAFSDLTVVNRKLVEMNNRLEQSESLKSNFLSNIRNEINNPLNSISGLAGQIVTLTGAASEPGSLAMFIGSEAVNLDFQLRNIFMAAELEAGEVDPYFSRADVVAVISDTIESFKHNAARKSVSVSLHVAAFHDPLIFATDVEKLGIVVSNLLSNAIEFSPGGGRIVVSIGIDEDGLLIISVRDEGPGIAETDKKRIFDRFVQLDTGSTRSHPGHGLGLSITKALIDLLQGNISVESGPELGSGSLFIVSLPLKPVTDDDTVFSEGGNLFLFDEMSEK